MGLDTGSRQRLEEMLVHQLGSVDGIKPRGDSMEPVLLLVRAIVDQDVDDVRRQITRFKGHVSTFFLGLFALCEGMNCVPEPEVDPGSVILSYR